MVMKWIFGTSVVVGVATLALGLMLVFSGSPASESPDDTRKLASALVTDGNGLSEGIQVHGDWIIEVYDPDGTLVEKREFENALDQGGQYLLSRLLEGDHKIVKGSWEILLGHRFSRRDFVLDTPTITENVSINQLTYPLAVSWPAGSTFAESAGRIHGSELIEFGGGSGITLVGSAILKEEDPDYYWEVHIDGVKTLVKSIEETYVHVNSFTEHLLPKNSIIVKEGQKVNVTVQIRFE